ncbi:hypothetical protein H4F52_15595 [Pectobacterium brasiliense]|uniref:hypothetical protein n=1 Tax=Pectobacterium brasiliense TaxID=180957 RepID=UPI0019691E08|nr:hypothetical protein [Pectobacterium brasiliense]MBN3133152.1 hypothetical protein [Pectobacterium brasiliense]
MERLYEIGKRFERLLYTSVLVVIASFLVSSLSNSILQNSSANRVEIFQDYSKLLKENEKDLFEIKLILDNHRLFKDKEEQRKSDFENNLKSPEEISKISIDNQQRKSLGLPLINLLDASTFKMEPESDYEKSLLYITSMREKFNLYKVKDLDEGWNTYREVLRKLADIASGMNFEAYRVLNYYIEADKSPADLIKQVNYSITEIKSSTLTILDVETPLNIPLAFGEVKSTISLYTIEKWTMIIMPIFFVIWLGSIVITRRYETYLLLESNRFINAYPHILNIFNFTEKRILSESVKNSYYLASLGDKTAIKNINAVAIFYFSLRVIIICGLLILMTFPAYYGFIVVIFNRAISNGDYYLWCITLCISINIIQILSLIDTEYRISMTIRNTRE